MITTVNTLNSDKKSLEISFPSRNLTIKFFYETRDDHLMDKFDNVLARISKNEAVTQEFYPLSGNFFSYMSFTPREVFTSGKLVVKIGRKTSGHEIVLELLNTDTLLDELKDLREKLMTM